MELIAETEALLVALQTGFNAGLGVQHIFITCASIISLISTETSQDAWHVNSSIPLLKHLLITTGHPKYHSVPVSWPSPANKIACLRLNLHSLTLFHQGRDLPKFVMDFFCGSGFQFLVLLFLPLYFLVPVVLFVYLFLLSFE